MTKGQVLAAEADGIYGTVVGEPTVTEDLLYVIAKAVAALVEEAEDQTSYLRDIEGRIG